MKRKTVLWVVWLLVCATVTGVSFWPGVGSSQSVEIPTVNSVQESPSSLQLAFNPQSHSINESKPAAFVVMLYNPPENEPTSVFLEIGVSGADGQLVMEVADEKPWYKHDEKTWWARQVVLGPGELRPIGIVVFPDSKPGEYELNTTASYILDGNYTKQSNVALLDIDSPPPPNGPDGIPSIKEILKWLGENWPWLFALLSLIVAILSFFGYERIKGNLKEWNGRVRDDDSGRDPETDHES